MRLHVSNAANLNALLQGLLGRACGCGKKSTVVMSDENVRLVEDDKRAEGGYIYKTSPHSLIAGAAAPSTLIRIQRDMDDPLIAQFFDRLDKEVVALHVHQDSATLRTSRATTTNGFRTGPLLTIAEELDLFDYLERADVRARLFPTYPHFRVARSHDEVTHSRAPNQKLRYTLDGNGNCRFTFREWIEGSSNHGSVRSRGYGGRDASDRNRAGDTLEPQINLRKFDPSTGQFIDDKRINGKPTSKDDRKPGRWRAEMVTLPLVGPVRELQAGEATYPIDRSPYSKLLSSEERETAGI